MTTEGANEETTDAVAAETATEAKEVSKTTLAAVAERLRFFFSDANVRQDIFIRKFLLNTVDTDTKDNSYPHQVPVECLLRFNTIKQHTKDPAVVVQAAKEFLSEKLIVSDDGKAIGVVVPFTVEKMDDNVPLSLYVSNLPVAEGKKYTVTTEQVRDLFGEQGIALVKFRFHRGDEKEGEEDITDLQPSQQQQEGEKNKKNKNKRSHGRVPVGAALVEFDSMEHLEKAAAETLTAKDGTTVTPSKILQLGGNTLSVMLLKDYIASRKSGKKSDDKRKASDEIEEREEETKAEDPVEVQGTAFVLDWKPGCVVSIKGIAEGNCDREGILEAVAKALDTTVTDVKAKKSIYVDYSRGQTEGAIRFSEPSDSVKVLCDKLAAGDALIAGCKVASAAILHGDDEQSYWTKFIAFKSKQQQLRKNERSSRKNYQNKRSRRS